MQFKVGRLDGGMKDSQQADETIDGGTKLIRALEKHTVVAVEKPRERHLGRVLIVFGCVDAQPGPIVGE